MNQILTEAMSGFVDDFDRCQSKNFEPLMALWVAATSRIERAWRWGGVKPLRPTLTVEHRG